MEVFNQFPLISDYLMEHVFRDLCLLILKVGLFPGSEVLECTSRFLELYMKIVMRVIQKGYWNFIKIPDHILATGKKQFYTSNIAKCDPCFFPFGEKLGNHSQYEEWFAKLAEGDKIDAVKFCKNETRAIWSRAVILELLESKAYVRFESEDSGIFHYRAVPLNPFSISPYKLRSVDFEWRQQLKKDDLVDYYFGRKGWILYKITDVQESVSSETGESIRRVSLELSNKDEPDLFSSDEEKDHFGRLVLTRPHDERPRPVPAQAGKVQQEEVRAHGVHLRRDIRKPSMTVGGWPP